VANCWRWRRRRQCRCRPNTELACYAVQRRLVHLDRLLVARFLAVGIMLRQLVIVSACLRRPRRSHSANVDLANSVAVVLVRLVVGGFLTAGTVFR